MTLTITFEYSSLLKKYKKKDRKKDGKKGTKEKAGKYYHTISKDEHAEKQKVHQEPSPLTLAKEKSSNNLYLKLQLPKTEISGATTQHYHILH